MFDREKKKEEKKKKGNRQGIGAQKKSAIKAHPRSTHMKGV